MRFATIVVDPAWQYNDRGIRGGTRRHYDTMTLDAIKALPVPDVAAENAHLYCWTTNAFVVEAHDVARAWNFEPKTILTWIKITAAGAEPFGTGHYFRNNTEHVIFAVRGELPLRRNDVPTAFRAERGRHSEKPARFYEMVESCSPGPYLEMFARAPRAGWATWGDELDGGVDLASVAVVPPPSRPATLFD